MLFKNAAWHQLLWKMPLKLTLDMVAACKFFLEKKPDDGKAVIRSITGFLGNLGKWTRHRKKVKARIKRHKAILPGLLAWERYIKGKKYFSALKF